MKKNYFILAAIASIGLASCSNDEYFGDPGGLTGEKAISFDMSTPSVTRAEYGETAANTLNRNFVLYGYKTMTSGTQVVFDNYQVNYAENTADKTESNSANWEYVGYKNLFNGVTANTGIKALTEAANYGGTEQSIKYWDWSATSYDFFAYSLGKGATVGENTTYATVNKMTENGYILSGNNAELAACYITDKIHRYDKTSENANFNKNNTQIRFSFRALNSKIRLGIYEIIPGYSVKDIKFYVDANTLSDENTTTDEKDGLVPTLYASDAVLPNGGSYTVSFDGEGAANVAFSGADKTNKISFGALSGFEGKDYREADGSYLGRTANNATKTAYQTILPNPTGTNLTLKVDYTLVSRDGSGENIKVTGAVANVPQLYAQWKPGYAYTYLFKISDNGNGEIGGVAGLYPITFDAVVEEVETAEGKVQETISTVATPSITTYQNGTKDLNEYKTGKDIFIVVDNNGTLLELDQADHPTYLYKVSSTPAHESYTEAEIIKALQVVQTKTGNTITGRNGITLTPVESAADVDAYGNDKWLIWNKIDPMVDGTSITVDADKNQVVKFLPITAGFYAFVYTDTKSDETVDKYEAVAELTAGTSVAPYYWYYKYVTGEDAIEGATYYTRSGEDPNSTYTVGAPDPAFYYGQTFAAGTDYYYGTNDGEKTKWTGIIKTPETGYNYFTKTGDTYTAVAAGTIIAYSDFEAKVADPKLYTVTDPTDPNETGSEVSATTPTPGTEYYTRTGENNPYTFTRVYILPQQTTGYYRLVTSETIEKCPAGEQAVVGKRYYDKYTQNQTTYAVKVIKVQ